jgi:hypothetical protein
MQTSLHYDNVSEFHLLPRAIGLDTKYYLIITKNFIYSLMGGSLVTIPNLYVLRFKILP